MSHPKEESADKAAPNRFAGVHLAVRLHRFKSLAIRYWWLLALTVVIGLSVQAYHCTQQPVRYISTGRMMVNGRVNMQEGATYSEELSMFYGTQVTLMKSPDTIRGAVARVRAIHPEVAVDDNAQVDAFQEPRTSIFDLQVVSTNPRYAQLLLDAVMDTYLSSNRGRKDQTTNGTISAITEEIAKLENQIHDDEQALLDFQKDNSIAFIEEQNNSTGTYLVSLNNEVAQLTKEHDLLALEGKSTVPIDSAPSADPVPVPPSTDGNGASPANDNAGAGTGNSDDSSSAIAETKDEIAKLKISRQEYGLYLKDMHPKMIALADQINRAQQFLEVLRSQGAETRDQRRQNLELQIKNIQDQIKEWNQKALDLSERLGNYQQLKGKIARDQALYNQLASSIQNVNVNKSIDQELVGTLDPASPASSVSPDYIRQLFYGLAYGLLGGLILIYLINRLDDKINSPLELEESVDYPLIGQLPIAILDRDSKRVPLLTETDERHILMESHRNIRSSILFRSTSVVKPKSLLITSSIPGEGKSTLAGNLAVTFALAKTRVLLIDADLRKGLLHNTLDLPANPGLTEYLSHEIPWRQAVQKTSYPNLDFLPRGKIRQQAGDLLLDATVDALLEESIAEYDMVLWDSAPVLATDDASSLCSKVGGVVFVSRVQYSSLHSVRSALDELSQRGAKIFGIVLNAVQPDQPGYYDRYRYKEYYSTVSEV